LLAVFLGFLLVDWHAFSDKQQQQQLAEKSAHNQRTRRHTKQNCDLFINKTETSKQRRDHSNERTRRASARLVAPVAACNRSAPALES
jgi:hypothetical protein